MMFAMVWLLPVPGGPCSSTTLQRFVSDSTLACRRSHRRPSSLALEHGAVSVVQIQRAASARHGPPRKELVLRQMFCQRFCVARRTHRRGAAGRARAVGVGSHTAALLFGQSHDDSGKGTLLTVDAMQPAPGGDAEAYLVVLPTP